MKKMKSRVARTRKLLCESLEDRKLMASDVSSSVDCPFANDSDTTTSPEAIVSDSGTTESASVVASPTSFRMQRIQGATEFRRFRGGAEAARSMFVVESIESGSDAVDSASSLLDRPMEAFRMHRLMGGRGHHHLPPPPPTATDDSVATDGTTDSDATLTEKLKAIGLTEEQVAKVLSIISGRPTALPRPDDCPTDEESEVEVEDGTITEDGSASGDDTVVIGETDTSDSESDPAISDSSDDDELIGEVVDSGEVTIVDATDSVVIIGDVNGDSVVIEQGSADSAGVAEEVGGEIAIEVGDTSSTDDTAPADDGEVVVTGETGVTDSVDEAVLVDETDDTEEGTDPDSEMCNDDSVSTVDGLAGSQLGERLSEILVNNGVTSEQIASILGDIADAGLFAWGLPMHGMGRAMMLAPVPAPWAMAFEMPEFADVSEESEEGSEAVDAIFGSIGESSNTTAMQMPWSTEWDASEFEELVFERPAQRGRGRGFSFRG